MADDKDRDDQADRDHHDDDHHDDDDGQPKPPPKPPGPPPKPKPQQQPGGVVVTTTGSRWAWPLRRYGQAQQQPADPASGPASFSTGPGAATEYHWHRAPTYHHQYAQDMTTTAATPGWENNPT